MTRPFELTQQELERQLEAMVDATISDLVSEFLLMPAGPNFLPYEDFRAAYEILKRNTREFESLDEPAVHTALGENSRVFGVVRAILGLTPPEWADLASTEIGLDIPQGAARALDKNCRESTAFISAMRQRNARRRERAQARGQQGDDAITLTRVGAMVAVAIRYINEGAPERVDGMVHRMEKFDTAGGLDSVRHAAREHVPYAATLYERYLGRPFATHRDSVSELVGEVMENAVEEILRDAGVTYRKTKRAERIRGFRQAPDFCIPDETNPAVVIEAKITSDDGTARDKVARMKVLAADANGRYEVVACIDGRGFRQRREDMRQLLIELKGKVFTTASLSNLLTHSRIREFVARGP